MFIKRTKLHSFSRKLVSCINKTWIKVNKAEINTLPCECEEKSIEEFIPLREHSFLSVKRSGVPGKIFCRPFIIRRPRVNFATPEVMFEQGSMTLNSENWKSKEFKIFQEHFLGILRFGSCGIFPRCLMEMIGFCKISSFSEVIWSKW